MLARGATPEMIVAAGIGYKKPGDITVDLRVWRATRVKRAADDYREQDAAIIERLLAHVSVPIGSGKTVEEKKLDLDRVKTALAILERRAKMFGTDAPKQVQVQGALLQLTVDDLRGMSTADITRALETGELPAPVSAQTTPNQLNPYKPNGIPFRASPENPERVVEVPAPGKAKTYEVDK